MVGLGWMGCVLAQSVVINEVVSRNQEGLEDQDGDRPDWMELYNPGGAAINLAGYGLSDDPGKPFKWRFPRVLIPSRGFLVVFASGKDRTNSAPLHTGFRLSAEGETLVLTRPGGQSHDVFPVPALLNDLAFGRQPDGSSNVWFLATPTPGVANQSLAGRTFLPAPMLSHDAGWYAQDFDLAMSSPEPGVEIRYTLDGSEPTRTSSLYQQPLRIADRRFEPNIFSLVVGTSTNNQHTDGWKPPRGLVRKLKVVRAATFRDDALPGQAEARSYAIGPATNAGLPVLSITLAPSDLFDFDRGIYMLGRVFSDWRRAFPTEVLTGHSPANYTQRGPDWERPAFLEYFHPNGRLGFSRGITLDIQGQSSRSFRQKSLGIKTRGNPISFEVFPGLRRRSDGAPLREFKHLRLRNSGNDWAYTLFRDALAHRLVEGLSLDNEAYQPALVFLEGEYWGIHNIREQQDPQYLASHYGVATRDAVICSAEGALLDGPLGANTPFVELREYVRTHDLADPAVYQEVARRIDLDNFIRYHAACIYLGNADWPHNNLRVWRDRSGEIDGGAAHPRDGRWRYLLFDADLALGHPWSGGISDPTLAAMLSPTGRPEVGGGAGWSTILFRGLIKNSEFRREFINTSADLLNSWFREARVAAEVESLRSAIAPAIPEHLLRWQTQVSSNAWAAQVRVLGTFASQRPIYLRQQYIAELKLAGYAPLTVHVSDPAAGRVRVNRLVIDRDLPGVNAEPYPWRGWYFRGVPVDLEAQPEPGWEFEGWDMTPDGAAPSGAGARLRLALTGPQALTARFIPIRPRLVSLRWVSSSRWQLEVVGGPQRVYRIQSGSRLGQWMEVGQILTDAEGRGRWETQAGSGAGQFFFRVVGMP